MWVVVVGVLGVILEVWWFWSVFLFGLVVLKFFGVMFGVWWFLWFFMVRYLVLKVMFEGLEKAALMVFI